MIFKSPGVFVQERDITVVKYSKRYSRRIKIGKIFGIDVPNVIDITCAYKDTAFYYNFYTKRSY
jgi:hypothetical protein